MATQRSVARTDLGNRSLDCLRHHQPSPFGVGSGLPVSSTQPYRGDDLIAKNFQLRAKVRSPLPIVELNGSCELLAQLADAAAVLLPGLGVEQRARIAEVCGRAARFDRQTSVAGCSSSRREFAGQDLAAGIGQKVGDAMQALGILDADHVVSP